MPKESCALRVSPEVVSISRYSRSATPAPLRYAKEKLGLGLPSRNGSDMGLYLSKASGKQIAAFFQNPGKWIHARYQYSDQHGRICIAHGLSAYIDAAPGLRGRMAHLKLDYHALLSASTLAKTRATSRVTAAPTSQATRPCIPNIKLGRPKRDCGWINADKLDRFLLRANKDDVQGFLDKPGDWAFARYAHCSNGGRKHEHGSLEQYLRARPDLLTRLRKLPVKHAALSEINMPERVLRTPDSTKRTETFRTTDTPTTPRLGQSTGSGTGIDRIRLRKEHMQLEATLSTGTATTPKVSGKRPSGAASPVQIKTEMHDLTSSLAHRHIKPVLMLHDAADTSTVTLEPGNIEQIRARLPASAPCTFFLQLTSTGEMYACKMACELPNQTQRAHPLRRFGLGTTATTPIYRLTVLGRAACDTRRQTQQTTLTALETKLRNVFSSVLDPDIQIRINSLATLSEISHPEIRTKKPSTRAQSPATDSEIAQFLAGRIPVPPSDHSEVSPRGIHAKSPAASPRKHPENQSSGSEPKSVGSTHGQMDDIPLKPAEDNAMAYFEPRRKERHMTAPLIFAVPPGEPKDSARRLTPNAVENPLTEWVRIDATPRTFFLHMGGHWLAGLIRQQENLYEIAMFSSIAPAGDDSEFVPEKFTTIMRPAFEDFLQRVAAESASQGNSLPHADDIKLTLCARAFQSPAKLREACGYIAMHMAHQVHEYESKPGDSLEAYFEDACTKWAQLTEGKQLVALRLLQARMQPCPVKTPASSTNTIGEQ